MENENKTIQQHLDAIGKLCETAKSLGYEVYGFELEGDSITLEFGKPIAFNVGGITHSKQT